MTIKSEIIKASRNYADILSSEQREIFMEVISSSLSITHRTHFFSWLQGGFQSLIPHEIMVCAIRVVGSESYFFDNYASTRYFSTEHFENSIKKGSGIISQIMNVWQTSELPVLIAKDLLPGFYGDYCVPFTDEQAKLKQAELINIVAHGIADREGQLSTFFSFSRMGNEISPNHAYILDLMLPHLHCALARMLNVAKSNDNTIQSKALRTDNISKREKEVLQWIYLGKTNWEIATILAISPLTVKNHVQNILRKLDVQNRRQAALKAIKIGFIESQQ